MRPSRAAIHIVWALLLPGAFATGCSRPTSQLNVAWPAATSEATIPIPASLASFPLCGTPAAPGSVVASVPVCAIVAGETSASPFGLADADVVYETADSGAGTQLACLFASRRAGRVGPLGSAGMPDLWIVPQYRAMLFSAGGTPNLNASMSRWPAGSNGSRDQGSVFAGAYRGSGEAASLDLRVAGRLADRFASSITSAPPASLRFSASVPASGSPISGVTIPFAAAKPVTWRFDRASGRYLRSEAGAPVSDAVSHVRVSADNVVVLWVRYAPLDADLAGGGGFDVTLGGSGQASLFRNGKRYDGRWNADGSSPPHLLTDAGAIIRLSPGLTWIEAIPLSTDITLAR